MELKKLISLSDKTAKDEIENNGLPTTIHYDLSNDMGIEIAKKLEANEEIVAIGTRLMDLKLGQAFKEKRLPEHVAMSSEASKVFLKNNGLIEDSDEWGSIINCVEAHHGTIPFKSIEAEICANADCYRFLHPKGVISYFFSVVQRTGDLKKSIEQVENKMNEKMAIASIPFVVDELKEYFDTFKQYFSTLKD